jgi:hypothetical protein
MSRHWGLCQERPTGFVAKFRGKVNSGWSKVVKREIRLGRETEQLADELSLADRIPFNQPSHAALSDHVHCFDALQRPPRTLKGSIARGQPNSLFDCSVSGLALGAGHVAAAIADVCFFPGDHGQH